MKKRSIVSKAAMRFKRGAPTILTCLGALGVIGTAVKVAMDTPKALKLLDEAQSESDETLTVVEKVVIVAPVYAPSMLLGMITIGCIFGANVLNKQKQASLASAYAMLGTSYRDYRRKVAEKYGEDIDESIKNAVIKEAAIPQTANKLNILFYEPVSNRFFESTVEAVQAAEYHINRNFILKSEVTLNEFYDFLGLTPTDYGAEVGWSIMWGDIFYGYSWIDFDHYLKKLNDGTEYYVIDMPFGPHDLDDECYDLVPQKIQPV